MEGRLITSNLASELNQEVQDSQLASLGRVDIICSSIKSSGLELLKPFFDQLRMRSINLVSQHQTQPFIRVITTLQNGQTDIDALKSLYYQGCRIKIFTNETPAFNIKGWLFYHAPEAKDVAYVGSSALSESALTDGMEWNVRVAEEKPREVQGVVQSFHNTFESYWDHEGEDWVFFNEEDEEMSRTNSNDRNQKIKKPCIEPNCKDCVTYQQHQAKATENLDSNTAPPTEPASSQSLATMAQQALQQEPVSEEQQMDEVQENDDMRDPQAILRFAHQLAEPTFSSSPQALFIPESDTLMEVDLEKGLCVLGLEETFKALDQATTSKKGNQVTAVVFSPDGKMIAASWYRGMVKVWDTSSRVLHGRFQGFAGVLEGLCSLAFLEQDESLVQAAICEGRIVVRGVTSGTEETFAVDNEKQKRGSELTSGFALALSQDGTMLAAVSDSDLLHVWTRSTKTLLCSIDVSGHFMRRIAFSFDNSTLAIFTASERLMLYDLAETLKFFSEEFPLGWNAMTLYQIRGEDFVALGSFFGSLWLREAFPSGPGTPMQGANIRITALALVETDEGVMLAIGSEKGIVKVWRVRQRADGSVGGNMV